MFHKFGYMMRKTAIKTAGLFLVSICFATGLNAQHYRGGANHYGRQAHRDMARQSMKERLDLTEEQQNELKTLREAHYETMKPLRDKMAELRTEERALLAEEKVDQKAVNKVIDEQTELTNHLRKLQVEHRLAFREVLTEEQLKKLEMHRERIQQLRSKGNERMGPPRRGRPYHRNWG
jgi:Spy/CpxP family protein refolding chaperone